MYMYISIMIKNILFSKTNLIAPLRKIFLGLFSLQDDVYWDFFWVLIICLLDSIICLLDFLVSINI